MGRIKAAIHIHTDYSFDSNLPVGELLAAACREGIHSVAITDHDEIDGALAAHDLAAKGDLRVGGRDGPPIDVIVGQEVSSADGHLIGLFLSDWVPPGLSAEETIARIREQGGLAFAPHPFARLCDNSLHRAAERIAHLLDAIEVHNAQNPLAWEDRRAAAFARRHGLTPYVGVDGHLRGRVAPAFQTMPEFRTPREFLASLRQAEFKTGRFGLWYFSRMGTRHVWDMLMPRMLPGFGVNVRPRGLPAKSRQRPAVSAAPVAAPRGRSQPDAHEGNSPERAVAALAEHPA